MAITQPTPAAGPSPLSAGPPDQLADSMKLLFQVGLMVFIVTAAIGILNSFHFLVLPQQVVLTHVHSGTLGWITIGVMTMGMWLFGQGEMEPGVLRHIRGVARGAVFALPLYVLGFLSGFWPLSALLALPAFGIILGFYFWLWRRWGSVSRTVAHLALLLGGTNLVLGAILGVLIQIQYATKASFLPGGAFGAHPAMMVVGYLLLMGMALAEFQLKPEVTRITRAGAVQVVLPFLAGIVLMAALITNNPKAAGLNVVMEVIAVVIFIIRFAPPVSRIRWFDRSPDRHVGAACFYVVVNVILLTYLIVTIIGNPSLTPASPQLRGVTISLDHIMFIGIMTNSILCMINRLSQARDGIWPWADNLIFWGMNLGMIGFVITLLTGAQGLEKFFVPIMGAGILLAIATYSQRLTGIGTGPAGASAAGRPLASAGS